MSLLDRLKNFGKRLRHSEPESTDLLKHELPKGFGITNPLMYDVGLADGFILIHRGPNRKERRRLQALYRQNHPVELLKIDGFRPKRLQLSRTKIYDRMVKSQDNFPIRKVSPKQFPVDRVTYCLEPEFWEFVHECREFVAKKIAAAKQAAEEVVESADKDVPLELYPANA